MITKEPGPQPRHRKRSKTPDMPKVKKLPADIEKLMKEHHNQAFVKDFKAFSKVRWLDEIWETANPEDLEAIGAREGLEASREVAEADCKQM